MSRPPTPLPPELGEPFRTADARSSGIPKDRLRARDLEAPFRGVRIRPRHRPDLDEDTAPFARDRARRAEILRLARAYALVAPQGAFFAGRTAALLHGCPVDHLSDTLDVAVHDPARAPRGRGIRAVKWPRIWRR